MNGNDPTWLDYISAFGAVTTPILVVGLTALGWKIRTDLERRSEIEDKLRDDRINAYNAILEPYIIMLMSSAAWTSDPKNKNKNKEDVAIRTMLSLDYRRHAFKMSLVADDEVVKAYNDLQQYVYNINPELSEDGNEAKSESTELIRLLGRFLLEVRKSMGNESTSLEEWDMLEWFLSDARKMRKRLSVDK